MHNTYVVLSVAGLAESNTHLYELYAADAGDCVCRWKMLLPTCTTPSR